MIVNHQSDLSEASRTLADSEYILVGGLDTTHVELHQANRIPP
jgi:hypothetical protein